MKKLGIGIQSFSKLISEGFVYVDKTPIIYQLVTSAGYYFLSRPRRFGKSLLVSTLREIFSGNRELFCDTWIYDRIEWRMHPVIHIDFSQINYITHGLSKGLEMHLDQIAGRYQIELPYSDPKDILIYLIKKLSLQDKVVLLIDEYDKPIIDFLGNFDRAESNREILKNFYSGIKGLDDYLRFVFVTGVSKFSKVSIFSDLNNLRDLTLSRDYSQLLGYTESEIESYFDEYLRRLSDESKLSRKALDEKIRWWYNGYSWDGRQFVYNPFSILNLFAELDFRNFWFTTGTPTFLTEAIRDQQIDVEKLSRLAVSQAFFDKFELRRLDIYSLLFQTGYLTIKEYDAESGRYYLSYPNEEVRVSLLSNLLEAYSHRVQSETGSLIFGMEDSLKSGDMESFIQALRSLFASIPYQIFIDQLEYYYQSVIYIALKLVGVRLACEVQTHRGRIDAVVETKERIYVMEFKMGSSEEALKQIEEQGYAQPYQSDVRELVKVGIGFSREARNIADWLIG